ncbi:hypothetical protein EYR40_010199 [Pleurotus pulmonarius]|nr:hypothetical protein EYR40_010199 [Pleurotus pulmonarius]
MDDCASTDSLRNYNYDCLSTKSFYSDDCTDATLQAELSGLILKDVDMTEYVQRVYGVSKADIEYIRSKGWQIEGLSTYTKLLDEDAKEEDLYGSFKGMMDGLFSTFTGDGLKLDVHYVSLGKTTLKSIGNVRKPEQLFFFGSHDDKSPVTWSLTKAFVELAVTPLTQRIAACNPTVATINEERTTTTTTEVLTDSAADLVPPPPLTSRPVFEPLRETWIEPLVDLFRKARANANLLARAKKGGQTSKRPARKPRKLPKYSDDESDEERIDADSEEDPVSSPPPTAQSLAVNVDFATLGGYLTFENFMKALDGWEPSGVPKKYREYAERLLEEEPVTATTPSSTAKSPGY